MPNVPIDAALCPDIRHSCRVSSAVEVLPFVPVTAATFSGNGRKNFAASSANALRGLASATCTAPCTIASGRATTATAPAAIAAPMKSSPLNAAPSNAPKTVPDAIFRWSMAKPVTILSANAGSAPLTNCPSFTIALPSPSTIKALVQIHQHRVSCQV